MIPLFRSIIISLPLIPMLCGIATARETAKERTCRILFLEGPDSAPGVLHLFDGTQAQEVELPRMNLSPVYQLPAGKLTLTLLPAAPADPANLPAGAPSVNIPDSVPDFYLLLTSDPSNAIAPVRMQVINAAADRLKRGQMLWFNLTNLEVGGRVGSEKLLAPPRSTVTLNPPASGARNYPVDLAYRMPDKETVYPICETQWLHDPRSRSLAFIFAKPGVRTPRVLVFPDYRHAEQKDDASP